MTVETIITIFKRVGLNLDKLCLTAAELNHCKAVYHAMSAVGRIAKLNFVRLVLSAGMKQPALLLGVLFGSRFSTVEGYKDFNFCIEYTEDGHLNEDRLPELMELLDRHYQVSEGTMTSLVTIVREADASKSALVDKLNDNCQATVRETTAIYQEVSSILIFQTFEGGMFFVRRIS